MQKGIVRMKKQKRLNTYLCAGITIVGVFVLLAVVSAFYTPYDPAANNINERLLSPSLKHLMGTDKFGRDVFSRVLKGIGTTVFVGSMVLLIGGSLGTVIGALTGYFGGMVDAIVMRINDALNGFPSVLLALVFVSVCGSGKLNVILALSVVFVPSFARVVRSEYIKLKEMDYVKAAKLMGASELRIIFVHIFPNLKATLIGAVTVGFNNAILAEASLSYLGIGVVPPDASLGMMLSEYQGRLSTAPWCAVCPGIVVVLLILGFSFIAEGIRRNIDGTY